MENILEEFISVLNKHGITITKQIEEDLFSSLRLIYKRMEGYIIDRKVLPNIDKEEIFTPLENILGKMLAQSKSKKST